MASDPSTNMYALTFIGAEPLSARQTEIDSYVERLGVRVVSKRELSARAVDYLVECSGSVAASVKSSKIDGVDIFFQDAQQRSNKQLFVFDMDLTLIRQEVIELIAANANIEHLVAEITTRAMNGELDFDESLRERVRLLKGIDASNLWEELKHKITLTNGARELCRELKSRGVVMAVCSGGFLPLAEHVKQELGLDYAYANVLGVTDSRLDGTTVGPIVNGDKKAELLLEIAQRHGIDPANAVAVGDGANDLKMMAAAGWGVAWHAKPRVQAEAPCCLNSGSLADILHIMGLP